MASIYAPITFHPSPVLVFKRTPIALPEGGLALGMKQEFQMTLVGTGSLGGVDPDRIILKKVRTSFFIFDDLLTSISMRTLVCIA